MRVTLLNRAYTVYQLGTSIYMLVVILRSLGMSSRIQPYLHADVQRDGLAIACALIANVVEHCQRQAGGEVGRGDATCACEKVRAYEYYV